MVVPLDELARRWMKRMGIDDREAPDPCALRQGFPDVARACRPPAGPHEVTDWEDRHGYRLPPGLRAWLELSNGLYRGGPLVHPISAIGPMVPFARIPGMIVQPESWFELGNPNLQTICIDLAYRLPGGDRPIFTSGDDASASAPRIIARGFDDWFLELLRQGGREYWFGPDGPDLGDPWAAHRRYVPAPPLSERMRRCVERARPMVDAGADERSIAARLQLSQPEVEGILRHLQHVGPAPSLAE